MLAIRLQFSRKIRRAWQRAWQRPHYCNLTHFKISPFRIYVRNDFMERENAV